MYTKYVIKALSVSGLKLDNESIYWNSSFESFSNIDTCTEYNSVEEASNRIVAKLPRGKYKIESIFIKE